MEAEGAMTLKEKVTWFSPYIGAGSLIGMLLLGILSHIDARDQRDAQDNANFNAVASAKRAADEAAFRAKAAADEAVGRNALRLDQIEKHVELHDGEFENIKRGQAEVVGKLNRIEGWQEAFGMKLGVDRPKP